MCLFVLPAGPLLRLQPPGETLSKAQRYAQPFDRPIYSSSIPPRKMQVSGAVSCIVVVMHAVLDQQWLCW